jgi:NAD(P)-dependent dehydrogenase (short-subunit alcohol dehydrogenase family)
VQKALPLLKDGGSIILNASIVASKGLESISVYKRHQSRRAIVCALLDHDLRHRQIRVNVISPGPIETHIYNKAGLTQEHAEKAKEGLVAAVPLGRMGTPDEVASASVFLASDDSSYVTGVELFSAGKWPRARVDDPDEIRPRRDPGQRIPTGATDVNDRVLGLPAAVRLRLVPLRSWL